MKFNFSLINSHIPPKKCGADPVSAVISGASNIIGGIGSAIIGADSASDSLSANIRENEKNRKFQSEEAAKNRQWQEKFAEDVARRNNNYWDYQFNRQIQSQRQLFSEQFNKQAKEWYNQQDYSNELAYQYWLKQQEYNSLENQVARAQQVGYNPSIALGNSTFGSTGLSAAPAGAISTSVSVPSPSGSAPSVPGGAMPSGSAMQVAAPSNFADSFSHIVGGVSNLVKSLASSRKDNAEAAKTEKTLTSFIQSQLEDVKYKQLLNTYQDAYNVFFSEKAPKELKQIGAQTDKILAEVLLTDALTDKAQMESITEQFNQLLLSAQKDLTHEQFLQTAILVKNLQRQLDDAHQLSVAQKNEANASAYEHTQSGRLRSLESDIQEFNNNIQTGNVDWDSETQRTKYFAMIRELAKGYEANEKEMAQINRYLETMSTLRGNRFTRGLDNLADYMNIKFGVNILGVPGLANGGRSVVKGFR